jgi:uncharacterized protein YndB with AHSA1/START domain
MVERDAVRGDGGQGSERAPIRRTVEVPIPPERAFVLFTEEMDSWWPREYTWAGDVLDTIGIEPRAGGHCYELGPHGFALDWGRVLVWQPPRELVFTWQISPKRVPEPNPARASEIEVRFEPAGEGATRVHLEHRAFDRHGPGAAEYRAGMSAAKGWDYILERYAGAASSVARGA